MEIPLTNLAWHPSGCTCLWTQQWQFWACGPLGCKAQPGQFPLNALFHKSDRWLSNPLHPRGDLTVPNLNLECRKGQCHNTIVHMHPRHTTNHPWNLIHFPLANLHMSLHRSTLHGTWNMWDRSKSQKWSVCSQWYSTNWACRPNIINSDQSNEPSLDQTNHEGTYSTASVRLGINSSSCKLTRWMGKPNKWLQLSIDLLQVPLPVCLPRLFSA